jgi:hypothetical protein
MAGLVYCFNTVGDSSIYKAGHTQNSLRTRLKGYLGLSKPRTIIFCRKVHDSVLAEKIMLTLFRQCKSLKERGDLGDEWFQDVSETKSILHEHLTNIADVVQRVSPTKEAIPSYSPRAEETDICNESCTSLKGMEQYFQHFDTFVNTATPLRLDTVHSLVQNFEDSSLCPVFPEFVLYTKRQRENAVSNRYSHLLPS